MNNKMVTLLIVAVLGLFALSQSVFFVPESSRAVVLQLGEPQNMVRSPGMHFRIPFIQSVVLLDNRLMMFTIDKHASFTSDIKSFDIDNYVCWRISNPLAFIRTLRTESEATERLRVIVFSQLRAAIGGKTLGEIVGSSRNVIMEDVLRESNKQASGYGVTFVDIRIKRADLPNRQAIFDRMNAERKRMANEYRFGGESVARDIRSKAELDRDTILAEAEREALTIRGQADAQALQTFSRAISQAPEFFMFSKSLEIYRKAFGANSKIILSTDDPLLRYFQ
ncbi:protease modulator HflC [Desulfovibrio cuneatus]|uniref:protease modulator HflC n=1 Tax=Desulfovibrio cuneatus TaxID=159728 RepID=UPI00040FBA27|nr:protease modulator HflC [Desulfovibrio cuneatus]